MNKIGIIVGAIALVLAGYLAVSLSSLQKKHDALALEIQENTIQDSIRESVKPVLPDLTVDESNLPIAYVDRDVLMKEYLYVKQIDNQLKSTYNTNQDRLSRDQKSLYERAQDVQQQGESRMISPAEYESKMNKLAEEEQSLKMRAQKLSESMSSQQMELFAKLQGKIDAYLKKYSSEFHYSYILTTGGMSSVLYASDSLNITDEIIEGLNADYKAK